MKLRLPLTNVLTPRKVAFDSAAAPLPQGQLHPTPHPAPHHQAARRPEARDSQAELALLHDQLRFHFGVRQVPRANPVMVRGRWFGLEPNDDAGLRARQWRFYLYQPCARCGALKPALQFVLWRPGSRDYELAGRDNFARRAWRYQRQIARRRRQSRAALQEFVQQPAKPCADCPEA